MTEFKNKIDFAVLFTVEKANPNGDPLMVIVQEQILMVTEKCRTCVLKER